MRWGLRHKLSSKLNNLCAGYVQRNQLNKSNLFILRYAVRYALEAKRSQRHEPRTSNIQPHELHECFRVWHPTSWGCKSPTHSQNSAIDKHFARDIRCFSKQHSKHTLKIKSGRPKIRNIRLSEKLGQRLFETFAIKIIRSSKNSRHSCPPDIRNDKRSRHSSKKSLARAKIRYIRVFRQPYVRKFETLVKNFVSRSKISKHSHLFKEPR